jgi:hypothetical protein
MNYELFVGLFGHRRACTCCLCFYVTTRMARFFESCYTVCTAPSSMRACSVSMDCRFRLTISLTPSVRVPVRRRACCSPELSRLRKEGEVTRFSCEVSASLTSTKAGRATAALEAWRSAEPWGSTEARGSASRRVASCEVLADSYSSDVRATYAVRRGVLHVHRSQEVVLQSLVVRQRTEAHRSQGRVLLRQSRVQSGQLEERHVLLVV